MRLDRRDAGFHKLGMIDILKRTFSWWHHATWGTSFTLWRRGAVKVGEDAQGNEYYEEGKEGTGPFGRKRRWVLYHGVAEGSRVPPDWRGWLYHSWDEPPTSEPLPVKRFERQYLPNMSGTPLAYRPKGSIRRVDEGTKVDQDYEAWSPEDA